MAWPFQMYAESMESVSPRFTYMDPISNSSVFKNFSECKLLDDEDSRLRTYIRHHDLIGALMEIRTFEPQQMAGLIRPL